MPSTRIDELSLADFKGQVVAVKLWASWCGPCRIQQPDLKAAEALLPQRWTVFVGTNTEDTDANALVHLAEVGVLYRSVFEEGSELADRFYGFGARSIQTTLTLDAEGRVAARLWGLTKTGDIALADALVGDWTPVSWLQQLSESAFCKSHRRNHPADWM